MLRFGYRHTISMLRAGCCQQEGNSYFKVGMIGAWFVPGSKVNRAPLSHQCLSPKDLECMSDKTTPPKFKGTEHHIIRCQAHPELRFYINYGMCRLHGSSLERALTIRSHVT
eukprot:705015-Pelagomonas_calceolata.AAC.1